MLICGSTVSCTRQKVTDTGGKGGAPGNIGGGINVFAGTVAAAMDVTSGSDRLDSALHASTAAAYAGPLKSCMAASAVPIIEPCANIGLDEHIAYSPFPDMLETGNARQRY
jgi:hypothetical protein